MKLRYLILPWLCLLLARPARAQTAFVTGNLTAIGAACTTSPPTNTNHITISTIGFGGATFTLSGTFVATVGFYASGDGGVTWQPLNVTPSNSSSLVTTATAVGLWQANVSAYTNICILDLVQTSGTAVARIHISTISARTGSSGGGTSIPSGGLTGQVLAVGPSNSIVASSPGLQDAAASPITGGTYTPVCGTTDTGDRARIFVTTGVSQIVVPASGGANCAHAVFYFLAQASTTFTFSTGDSFDVYDGNTRTTVCATGCTSTAYGVAAGQYVTAVNGAGTVWHFLVESPGGAGGGTSSLSALTAATAANTIANGNNIQTWNWASTNPNAGMFTIGESAPSSGGTTNSVGLATQAVVSAQTLAGSSATPFSVNQGAITNSAYTLPVAQFSTTWNNAALVGSGLAVSVTNTASAAGSNLLTLYGGTSGNTSEFSVNSNGTATFAGGIVVNAGFNSTFTTGLSIGSSIHGTTSGGNLSFSSGIDGPVNGNLGGALFRGGDNNSNAPTAGGGYAVLRGGVLYGNYTVGETEGATEVAAGYRAGTIAAAFDAVCGTTTAFTVSDCAVTPQVNVIGIATGTAVPVNVVTEGTVPVHLVAALTNIGDTVCLSTTIAGAMVDSGGQANCAAGTQVGVIVAAAGTLQVAGGLTSVLVTLSTTQPLVQLHLR